jgi:hypothetical protein
MSTSSLELVRHSRAIDRDDYATAVLSSRMDIRQLSGVALWLTQNDEPMLDPEFFLASVSKGWRPRVVTVYRARKLIGILYAQERVVSDIIPTGVVYCDGSLSSFIIVNPEHQQPAFLAAVRALLSTPGIRGVRLRLPPGCEALGLIRQLNDSQTFDVRYSRIHYRDSPLWKYHAHLSLPGSYGQFLGKLGSTTRHNFRYYRRRFEASGHTFVDSLAIDEFRSAALYLASKSKFNPTKDTIVNGLTVVAAAGRPLAIGLKHQNGEWLSVLGGWYRPDGAVLFFQCNNDRDYGADSLSVVLRGYCIEHLIGQGLKELVIWAETGPPLSRYVKYFRSIGVQFDLPSHWWRAIRFLGSKVGPLLPKQLGTVVQWFTCFWVSIQMPEWIALLW